MKRCRSSDGIVGEFSSAINYRGSGYGRNGARESIMRFMIEYDTLLRMHSSLTKLFSQQVQVDPEQAPCPQDRAPGTEEKMGAHDGEDLEGKALRPVPGRVRAEREQ